MYKSLKLLSDHLDFQKITIEEIIDKLNSIGFEVEEVEKKKEIFYSTIGFFLKMPANRQDLFIEKNFLSDFAFLLETNVLSSWKKYKKYYYSFLLQHYKNSEKNTNFFSKIIDHDSNHEAIFINFQLSGFIKNHFSPAWVQKRLIANDKQVYHNIFDILEYIGLEWGHKIEVHDSTSGKVLMPMQTNNLLIYKKLNFSITYNSEEGKKTAFLETFRFSLQRFLSLVDLFDLIEFCAVEKSLQNNESFLNKKIEENFTLTLQKNFALQYLNEKTFDLNIFEKAGLNVDSINDDTIVFNISTMRRDLKRQIDIIEEYCRFFGYKNFLPIRPEKKDFLLHSKRTNINLLKDYFLYQGFQEVCSVPFCPSEDFEEKKKIFVHIKNPLTNEFHFLRTHLIPNLLTIYSSNLTFGMNLKNYFEIGRCFLQKTDVIYENEHLAGIFQVSSYCQNKNVEWFFAKSLLETFFQSFPFLANKIFSQKTINFSFFHKNRSISFFYKKKQIGIFGEIALDIQKSFHVSSLYGFEIDLNFFIEFSGSQIPLIKNSYSKKIIRLKKDFSFFVEKTKNFQELKNNILGLSKHIHSIYFFDIYLNSDLEDNFSLSVGLRVEFVETETIALIESEILKIKDFLIEKYSISFK